METTTKKASEADNKPVNVFRNGALSVSVFENSGTRDGKPSPFYKATISKVYKKKGDEGFARTSSFTARDFPAICLLLIQAGEYIKGLEGGATEDEAGE